MYKVTIITVFLRDLIFYVRFQDDADLSKMFHIYMNEIYIYYIIYINIYIKSPYIQKVRLVFFIKDTFFIFTNNYCFGYFEYVIYSMDLSP